MRVPSWEISPGALAAFLNTTAQGYLVDLYSFTLSGDTVLRYTIADVPVTVNGIVYATGPVIKRGKTRLSVGVSVDSLDVTLAANTSLTINGVSMLPFIAGGGFDGSRVLLERAYASAPGADWVGTLSLFKGRVSDTQTSRYESQITINSDSELLNVMVPRNVYQPGCLNTLFDNACGLSKSASAVVATATSGSNASLTTFGTALGHPVDYFSLGFAVCLTGANAGVSRTVRSFASGIVTTIQPWPVAVAAGDTFTLYPGCDKTQSTCATKFANLARFRGQPYIPAPETIA